MPFISVLTDPTTGGVFASYAAVGDVNVAEPNALIGFAGARVSAGTISQELPPGFQRSEFLFSHGFVDRVVERPDLRDELARLLRLLRPAVPAPGNGELDVLPGLPAFRPLSFLSDLADRVAEAGTNGSEPEPLPDDSDGDRTEEVWGRVQLARNLRRPRTLEFVDADDRGLRRAARRPAVRRRRRDRDRPCPARRPASSLSSASRRAPTPTRTSGATSGCRTRRAIARRSGSWSSPSGSACRSITFVDVPGAHPGAESEERGIAESIARSVALMTRLRTQIVTVITGEGGSGGALAIAVGDVVIALENAVYSVISPEGCASILWRTPDEAPTAAVAMRMTAAEQQSLGVVDIVVPEPAGGAHTDVAETARRLRAVIVAQLDALTPVPIDGLLEARYRRYRDLGPYTAVEAPTVAPPVSRGLADRLRDLIGSGRWPMPVAPGVRSRDEPPANEEV